MLLFMLLVVAGDVERNPGPLSQEGTACVLSTDMLVYMCEIHSALRFRVFYSQ